MNKQTETTVRELPPGFMLAERSHSSFDEGACLMEAVAYLAGEPHSDHPKCACPVLTSFGIRINDRFSNEERQLLAPLIPKLVGTRATEEVKTLRRYSLVDSAIRVIVPMAMDAVGWEDLGDRLRAISEVTDEASASTARSLTDEVRLDTSKRRYSGPAAAYAAAYAAYAAASDAYAAAAAAYAAAYAAYAAASDAAAALSRAQRLEARRPIILATIAAFEKAIAITEESP